MTVKIYQSGSFHSLAGAKVYHNGAWVTLPATAKVYLNNGWHYLGNVSSGVVANNNVTVSSGWIYIDTTINSGGKLHVNSGGTADSIIINSNGGMLVNSGGIATKIMENGGYANIFNAESATFTSNTFNGLVFSKTSATVHSGTTANNVTVNSSARLDIFSKGNAINTTVISGGYLYVSSGGTANNITVNTWGRVDVASGGTALGVAWTPGVGRGVNVFDGAHVTYTSNYSGIYVGDGSQLLSHPATMTGETVDSRLMYVMSGGTASSITFTGVTLGSMYVSNSGVVQNTTLSNWGSMHVCNGGMATNTKVGFHGYMYVFSGGTANSITVSSGGNLYISSGGTALNVTSKAGAEITVKDGGTITYA